MTFGKITFKLLIVVAHGTYESSFLLTGINAIIRQYPYSEHPFSDLDMSSVDAVGEHNNFYGATQLVRTDVDALP
jgi:hypothetical protein